MAAVQNVVSQAKLRVDRARARHSWIDVGVRTFKRFGEDDGGMFAAALTYYMFFSIFPLLLVSAAVLGLIAGVNDHLEPEEILSQSIQAFPLLGSVLTAEAVEAIRRSAGQLAAFGVVLAVYSGSGGVVALAHALNKIDRVEQERNFVGKRLASLRWLSLLGAGVILTVGLGTVAGWAGAYAAAISIPLGLALNVGLFLVTFMYLPNSKRGVREALPGAVVAGAVFEILKQVGTLYLNSGAEGRSVTFGAFAAAATFLVASYLLAQVTLLAAEVNAVLAERRTERSI